MSFSEKGFPCISTGVYGYDPEQAAHVALYETRMFLTGHHDKVDRDARFYRCILRISK